ncbi:phage/plasmid primase, P4 family [Mesomycoplasma lagogenitalium]|uniref:Phage/plasmid primase, P4 family n=1 Tax=Mesomycoplasma lagogenitalium TaxID=171286 RepID=A0ABY8LTA0_9BACT|nr:phage/plasmid primase, P4 family [Mesomycoplasma lagogenitalium]WGI36471.1 phage/plasmid primase, P4 family [Mesomycoplasma lagogenitalium]
MANQIDTTALKNFYNNSDFIILNDDKSPFKPFKDGKNIYQLNEIQNEENIGILLNDNWVVVDIDNKDNENSSSKLIEIIDTYGFQCNIMKTTRGHHFWFKSSRELKNWVDVTLPIGIKADLKVFEKNSFVVIKAKGRFREWLRFFNKVDFLPMELTPINQNSFAGLDCPVNLKKGSRRDNLFNRIGELARSGWSKQQAFNLLTVINKKLFLEPLDDYEVDNCFKGSDKFFEKIKEKYYEDKTFLYLKMVHFLIDEYKIVKYAKQLYAYEHKGNYYRRIEDNELMELMLMEEPMIKSKNLKEVLQQLKVSPYVEEREPEKNIIALNNCYYNLDTYSKIPYNFNLFVINKINVTYDPRTIKQNTAKLEKFFNDITLNDNELFNIMMEFIGYCLTFDTRYQKALLLYGASASNGKSTFIELLSHFFNPFNVSNLSLEDFSKRFTTSVLIDKMVNIGADIKTDHIPDPSMFKKLVSGDEVLAEFKGKDFFKFKNKAKLIFATNKLPSTNEKTNGYFRRFLIVPFLAEFKGKSNDKNILEKLLTKNNMNVLFSWAILGLKRLRENGEFTFSEKVNEILNNYEKSNNSIHQYLEDSFFYSDQEIKSGLNVINKPVVDIYNEYKDYCLNNGFKALSKVNFKSEVLLYYRAIKLKTKRLKIERDNIFKEVFFKQ